MEKMISKWASRLFAGLILVVMVVLTAGGARSEDVNWTGGLGDGLWSSGGNWDLDVPIPDDTAIISNGNSVSYDYIYDTSNPLGDLQIDGGSTLNQDTNTTLGVVNTQIGIWGTGTYSQSAGTHEVQDFLTLGVESGSTGNYNLSGGVLSTSNEAVGNSGTGVFTQSDGTHYVGFYPDSTPMDGNFLHELLIGRFGGSDGHYILNGTGGLHVAREIVGDAGGTGLFEQSGSSVHAITNDLIVGQDTGAAGEYSGKFTLGEEGNLSAGREIIGDEGGVGVFEQTGGTNETDQLIIGAQSESSGFGVGGNGTYNLNENGSSATLIVNGAEIVGREGTGTFIQEAGDHDVNGGYEIWHASGIPPEDPPWKQYAGLVLGQNAGSSGTFTLTGGTLDVANATIVGGEGNGTFNLGDFIPMLTSGPISAMATTGGPTHTTGDLYVGYLSTRDDEGNFTSEGVYNLNSGTLNVVGGNGLMGFTVIGGKDYNPVPGTGVFNQYGGTHNTGGLFLSDTQGSVGTYNLYDGTLSTGGWDAIGGGGTGVFNQYGGTHTTTGALNLGNGDTADGTYELYDGALNVTESIDIGVNGIGNFIQHGGTNTVGTDMAMGTGTGEGTYNLSNGDLVVEDNVYVGATGTGTFIQTGGDVYIGGLDYGNLILGNSASGSGAYNLHGGDLSANWIAVGNNQGTGTVTQGGGELDVRFDLVLAQGLGSTGTYNLNVGGIHSAHDEYLGAGGTATFIQNGGTNVMVSTLVVGWTDGTNDGDASYTLNNGYVKASNVLIAAEGTGTFDLKGGTLEVTDNILNNDTFNYSGGTLNVAHTITNNGTTTLSGAGTRTVNGDVVNNGTFKVDHTEAVYTGTFTNNGAYISDPSVNTFNGDLVVGTGGYLQGGAGDAFYIFGNFLSNSTMNTKWNTEDALLGFLGIETSHEHDFWLTGEDFGGSGLSGYSNNFAWDTLDLTGEDLHLFDGNGGNKSTALYVDAILGADISGDIVNNIYGNGFNIYYLASDNAYLAGLTYNLMDGGFLAPAAVPIPSTVFLLFSGLVGLLGVRRRRIVRRG